MNNAINDFIENLYRRILLREGETGGIAYWTEEAGKGLSSIEMVKGFITSPEAQSIIAVLRLYHVFFGRTADLDGLRYWVAASQGGLSLNDIAFNFSRSEEYKQKHLDTSLDDLIESFYVNLLGRASDAAGKSYWLNVVQQGGWNPSQVAAAFTVTDEAMELQGNATRLAESFLVLRSSNGRIPATEEVKALAERSLIQGVTELQTVRGTVQAGRLEHALVYRAADESALEAAALIPLQTDGGGNFMLTGGYGDFYAIGGRDVTTGLANERWLSALNTATGGEIMITPLTTIIHALVRKGTAIADALLLVNQAFAIDSKINLASFDHLDKAIASGSSIDEKKSALTVKAVIAQISILTEGVAALIKGTAGTVDTAGIDASMISLRVAEALAEKIAAASADGALFQAAAPLELDATDVVAKLIADSLLRLAPAADVSLKNAATDHSVGLADDAARIIAILNSPIGKALDLIGKFSAFDSGSVIDMLSLIAKTEGWAIGEMQTLIGTGMQDGSLENEAAMLSARNFGSTVQSFNIGRIADGVASTNASSVFNLIFNMAPPAGGGDTIPPDFFVTDTLGKLTFSGSATGTITLAIDMAGAISFSRGGLTAATKGSALSAVVIDLSSGQILQLAHSQLAQIADFTIKGGGNLDIQGALTLSALNGIHFDQHTGGVSYRIEDTPANILNAAPASLSGAQEVTVIAGTNVFYGVASATQLLSRLTSRTGLTLGVEDTAAAILADHAITGITAYRLSGNASDLSVANAVALIGISGFDANGKTITVLDTAAAILGNHSITGANAYRLSENASDLSIADAVALAGISGFNANGKVIMVLDTAVAILSNSTIDNVTAYKLSANAINLNVATAAALASATGFSANGKDFIVQDTAAAIQANHTIAGVTAYKVLDTHTVILNNHAAMSYASAFLLSADVVDMTVADAAVLGAVNGLDVNGRVFSVKDSFTAIESNHAIAGVTKYQFNANVSVQNVELLQSDGLALAKLHYTLADTASAISAASTSLLNGSDGLFSTASSGNDQLDLNRGGDVTVRMSIDLGGGDDIILGSEGVDHINGNTGADTMDGGPGQDFYTYSDKGTDSPVNSGAAPAAGFDTVDIRGGDGFYIAEFAPSGSLRTVLDFAAPGSNSGTDLLTALDAAYASVRMDVKDVLFVRFVDSNQYLVINDGQDSYIGINASDTVIKIIGSGLPTAAGSNLVIFGA